MRIEAMSSPELERPPRRSCRIPGTEPPCYLFSSHEQVARRIAATIAALVRERNSFGQKAVLGLPTGSSVLAVYRELIRLHEQERLDFANVEIFGVAEYHGLRAGSLQTCARWLHANLLRKLNVPAEQVHLLDSNWPVDECDDACKRFEAELEEAGGLDLIVLEVGGNGRIGFNEPFSVRQSRTRLVRLDPVTRLCEASNFFSEEHVPVQGLTLGIGTILAARKILLVALGDGKAKIARELTEGPVTDRVPASFLREHHEVSVLVDAAAAQALTAVATPWVLGNVDWPEPLIKRAVLWLAERTGKALLKLDDNDFRAHNLHQLLRNHGPAQRVAQRAFSQLMGTIQDQPGGREPRKVLCFSPHPDDDVISMGGTLIRLVEDGHEVHIAYMTSGNIAVFDRDALRIAELVDKFNQDFQWETAASRPLLQRVRESLTAKQPGEPDGPEVAKIKTLIRWSEAKAAARICGCNESQLHYLNLPFYCTGTIEKNPIGRDDVRIVRQLLEEVRPAQIYMAGDLSDPHGTHRMCAEAIFRALWEMEAETGSRPETLLYRGAWQEYPLHEIEMAVPLSPCALDRKIQAIMRHESQKDDALFPGEDPRQFWQRAEDRNRQTADGYNRLGLPEYYAMEGFTRWTGEPL